MGDIPMLLLDMLPTAPLPAHILLVLHVMLPTLPVLFMLPSVRLRLRPIPLSFMELMDMLVLDMLVILMLMDMLDIPMLLLDMLPTTPLPAHILLVLPLLLSLPLLVDMPVLDVMWPTLPELFMLPSVRLRLR